MLFDVYLSGDSGSPRVAGSISPSKSVCNVGSFSVFFFRPPPSFRKREIGFFAGDFNSLIPLAIVSRDIPVALETIDVPPRPIAFASAAAQ